MLATFYDTETTGLDPDKGDRIIEVAMLTIDFDSRKVVDSYVQRINPECAIDAKASDVHGIFYADVAHEPVFAKVASAIHGQITKTDLMVAHNASFDIKFLAAEFAKLGIAMPNKPGVDTIDSRWATPNGKSPNLGELAFALGVDYDPSKAHSALYDCQVCAECFFRGFDRGFFQLPKELTV